MYYILASLAISVGTFAGLRLTEEINQTQLEAENNANEIRLLKEQGMISNKYTTLILFT